MKISQGATISLSGEGGDGRFTKKYMALLFFEKTQPLCRKNAENAEMR